MSLLSSRLIRMDLSAGASAVDYTPKMPNVGPPYTQPLKATKPILGFMCISSTAGSTVKITPAGSANVIIGSGATSGSGGRVRIETDGKGRIILAEIAAPGSGYINGPVSISVQDDIGRDAVLALTASGGILSAISIVNPGQDYSGTITFDSGDFIEGVIYPIIPRYVEITAGATSNLTLVGFM
jgi:hypothetical protein